MLRSLYDFVFDTNMAWSLVEFSVYLLAYMILAQIVLLFNV